MDSQLWPKGSGTKDDPIIIDSYGNRNKPIINGEGKAGIHSANGYKLLENSPAIGAGKIIKNHGGHDYWKNKVFENEKPNRGAYNGSGIENKYK